METNVEAKTVVVEAAPSVTPQEMLEKLQKVRTYCTFFYKRETIILHSVYFCSGEPPAANQLVWHKMNTHTQSSAIVLFKTISCYNFLYCNYSRRDVASEDSTVVCLSINLNLSSNLLPKPYNL